MATKRPLADDDGNIIPPPPPDSPVWAAIYLLEYARKRQFKIGPNIQVGDLMFNVTDLQQLGAARREGPAEVSIWKAHGYDGDDND